MNLVQQPENEAIYNGILIMRKIHNPNINYLEGFAMGEELGGWEQNGCLWIHKIIAEIVCPL